MALDPTRVDLGKLPPMDVALRNIEYAIVDANTFEGKPTADHSVNSRADPRLASGELGERHFIATVERLSREILEILK
jgi:hypothetical protein